MKLNQLILFSVLSILCTACDGSSDSSESPAENSLGSTPSSINISSPLTQQIDEFLKSNQSGSKAGVSILVMKDGEIVYSGGKGMARLSPATNISSKTGFRLASVSKSFTAIAIMQLVEQGQLNLNDSLLTYIPELPASWKNITIDQLLSHQSGIADIINDGWKPNVLNGLTNDSLITYLSVHPDLEFTPGTNADYSNTGFMLLAKVIERKTGLKFSDYMAQKVFEPAGMTGSYITDENQPIKAGDALNYASQLTYYGIQTYTKGSMAQVSSTEDFSHFFEALRNNKLVSAETFATITRQHSTLRYSNLRYGYGFMLEGNAYGHNGEWDGFETEMMIDPVKKVEWVILTNSGSAGRVKITQLKAIISNYYHTDVFPF